MSNKIHHDFFVSEFSFFNENDDKYFISKKLISHKN